MSTARRWRRVMLLVAALVLGIGSCQLPQPRVPKLPVGSVAGAVAATRALTIARDGPS